MQVLAELTPSQSKWIVLHIRNMFKIKTKKKGRGWNIPEWIKYSIISNYSIKPVAILKKMQCTGKVREAVMILLSWVYIWTLKFKNENKYLDSSILMGRIKEIYYKMWNSAVKVSQNLGRNACSKLVHD